MVRLVPGRPEAHGGQALVRTRGVAVRAAVAAGGRLGELGEPLRVGLPTVTAGEVGRNLLLYRPSRGEEGHVNLGLEAGARHRLHGAVELRPWLARIGLGVRRLESRHALRARVGCERGPACGQPDAVNPQPGHAARGLLDLRGRVMQHQRVVLHRDGQRARLTAPPQGRCDQHRQAARQRIHSPIEPHPGSVRRRLPGDARAAARTPPSAPDQCARPRERASRPRSQAGPDSSARTPPRCPAPNPSGLSSRGSHVAQVEGDARAVRDHGAVAALLDERPDAGPSAARARGRSAARRPRCPGRPARPPPLASPTATARMRSRPRAGRRRAGSGSSGSAGRRCRGRSGLRPHAARACRARSRRTGRSASVLPRARSTSTAAVRAATIRTNCSRARTRPSRPCRARRRRAARWSRAAKRGRARGRSEPPSSRPARRASAANSPSHGSRATTGSAPSRRTSRRRPGAIHANVATSAARKSSALYSE